MGWIALFWCRFWRLLGQQATNTVEFNRPLGLFRLCLCGSGFGPCFMGVAGLLWGFVAQAAPPLYSITDLGSFGGTFATATGINNSGQIVGYSDLVGNTAEHAFLYSGGVISDLGTLGGTNSTAFGINNKGQAVGGAYLANNTTEHAFLYSGGVMSDLGTLSGYPLRACQKISCTTFSKQSHWARVNRD